jgi:hypothetical protein
MKMIIGFKILKQKGSASDAVIDDGTRGCQEYYGVSGTGRDETPFAGSGIYER